MSRLTTAIKDAFRSRWPQAEHAPIINPKQQSTKSIQSTQAETATENQSFDGAPIQHQSFENAHLTDVSSANAASTSSHQNADSAVHNQPQQMFQAAGNSVDRPATRPLASESQVQLIEHGATSLSLKTSIAKLASYANIEDAVTFDDVFPLGYWIDVPDFQDENTLVDGEIAIDTRSHIARSVWWFLLTLSEQTEREKESLYMLPEESQIKQCILDDNLWYDLMLTKVGMVETGYVEHWLRTESEEFVELLLDVFKCLRGLT